MRLPQIECVGCGASVDYRTKNATCRPCRQKPCADCGKTLSFKNESGRCASCFAKLVNADPELTKRRADGLRHKIATDPMFAAKLRAVAAEMGFKAGRDPELRKRRVAHGKWMWENVLSRPDVRAKNLAAVKGNGPKQSAYWMGWCPPEYRDEYRFLTKTKKLSRPEAQAVIFAEIARKEAALSPFERQERALQRGAQIVANDAAPNPYAAQSKWSVG